MGPRFFSLSRYRYLRFSKNLLGYRTVLTLSSNNDLLESLAAVARATTTLLENLTDDTTVLLSDVFTNKRSQAKVSTVYLSYWWRIDNIDNT